MALDDRFHFVTHVIQVGLALVVPMVEEDGKKGGESCSSVRAVTVSGAISSSGASVAEHWRMSVSVQNSPVPPAYRFPG